MNRKLLQKRYKSMYMQYIGWFSRQTQYENMNRLEQPVDHMCGWCSRWHNHTHRQRMFFMSGANCIKNTGFVTFLAGTAGCYNTARVHCICQSNFKQYSAGPMAKRFDRSSSHADGRHRNCIAVEKLVCSIWSCRLRWLRWLCSLRWFRRLPWLRRLRWLGLSSVWSPQTTTRVGWFIRCDCMRYIELRSHWSLWSIWSRRSIWSPRSHWFL